LAKKFFIDPQRCIGCRACMAACQECDTHRGVSMIYIDTLDTFWSPQTSPTVCMHCVNPPCANACPVDAIKVEENGIVLSALVDRCIYCRNCVYACPFGIPKYQAKQALMIKCDQCYDRTSKGKKPWCATACPTGALDYGEYDEVVQRHPGQPINQWQFGEQTLETNVYVFAPQAQTPEPKYEILHIFDYRAQAGYAPDGGLTGGQQEIKGESAEDVWAGWETRDWSGWSALEDGK
jgi:Fe-S-cluster-containing dehydrogenase component